MHRYFKRGRVDLLIHILRKTNSKGLNAVQSVQDIVKLQHYNYHQQQQQQHNNNNSNISTPIPITINVPMDTDDTFDDESIDENDTLFDSHNNMSLTTSTTDNTNLKNFPPIIGAINALDINSHDNNSTTLSSDYHYENNNTSFYINNGGAGSMPIPLETNTDMEVDTSNIHSSTTQKPQPNNNRFTFTKGFNKFNKTNNGSNHPPSLAHQDINQQHYIISLQRQIRELTLERDMLRTYISNGNISLINNNIIDVPMDIDSLPNSNTNSASFLTSTSTHPSSLVPSFSNTNQDTNANAEGFYLSTSILNPYMAIMNDQSSTMDATPLPPPLILTGSEAQFYHELNHNLAAAAPSSTSYEKILPENIALEEHFDI